MEKLCEGPHVQADFQPALFVARLLLPNTDRDGDPSRIFASTPFLSFSTNLPLSSVAVMQQIGSDRRHSRHGGLPLVTRSKMVESECDAVAVGRTYLFPPLSSGGALVFRP